MQMFSSPRFARLFEKLPLELQRVAITCIEEFKDRVNHKALRVHPLHGTMKGRLAFSVNNTHRIVFIFEDKKKTVAVLLSIGDHDIYR